MAIDFSYLNGATPQEDNTPKLNTANVTIRVDAECVLYCDGECIDVQLKAGVITKTKIPVGSHLLEFISSETPLAKVEKVVDFPVANMNYVVLISELSEAKKNAVKAEAELMAEEEARRKEVAKRKAEEEAQRVAEIERIAHLAEDYYYGRNGKPKDYEKAATNFRIAAEAGDAYSQYSLGFCYENGQGVEQSLEDAAKWYRKAADQGFKDAMERLKTLKVEGALCDLVRLLMAHAKK